MRRAQQRSTFIFFQNTQAEDIEGSIALLAYKISRPEGYFFLFSRNTSLLVVTLVLCYSETVGTQVRAGVPVECRPGKMNRGVF